MKILYLHQHFTTPKGSGGIRSYEMAQKCIKEGINVTMVCGSHSGGNSGLEVVFKWGKREGYVNGIYVIEFDLQYSNKDNFLKRSYLFLLYSLRAIYVALTYDYDIVFATTTPLTAGIPGIFARWMRRKQFIFEVRDLWPELPKAMGVIKNPIILKLLDLLEWTTYKSANKLIGVSQGICNGIESKGVSKESLIEVPNGCDLELFSKESTIWRPEGVKSEDVLFIFSGAHGLANGLDALLDAVNILVKRNITGYKIVLIGNGKLKPNLIKRAKLEKLDENIIFLDPVPKEKLIGLLKSSDVGLQLLANIPAFYYGTSPNKFFDYLSAGLPVLTNYPGWVADLIRDNRCGFTCDPGDSTKFADAIIDAINSKNLLKKLGENAHNLAKEKFDRSQLSEKWLDWVIKK
jgi:glycosyltransferase involved in cell wall biosynthesis